MREARFTFLCDRNERRMITRLATQLKRTESDAVRLVIREAVRALEADAPTPITSTAQPVGVQHDSG
jgi:hypothetical protein